MRDWNLSKVSRFPILGISANETWAHILRLRHSFCPAWEMRGRSVATVGRWFFFGGQPWPWPCQSDWSLRHKTVSWELSWWQNGGKSALISLTQNSNGLVTAPSLFWGFSEPFSATLFCFSLNGPLFQSHSFYRASWILRIAAVAVRGRPRFTQHDAVQTLEGRTRTKYVSCPRNSKASRVPWTFRTPPRVTVFMHPPHLNSLWNGK